MEWEITQEDIQNVLSSHNVTLTDEEFNHIYNDIDHAKIINDLLAYMDMDTQTASMLSDIEDYLIENNIVTEKKFFVVEE